MNTFFWPTVETFSQVLNSSIAFRLRIACALIAALIFGTCQAGEFSFRDEQIVETGFFSKTKAVLIVPDKPVAVALLFPGGDGALRLSGSKALVTFGTLLQFNFLVRSRGLFFENGVATLVLDSPGGLSLSPLERMSAIGSIKDLLEKVYAVAPELKGLPMWAVGTSAGTISVGALLGYAPELLSGAVLTSSVTRQFSGISVWSDRHPRGVADVAGVSSFKKPVLVISHRDDGCYVTPASDAEMLAASFKASPRSKAVVVEGVANPAGDPCESMSPHGFYDMEKDVVQLIAAFIKTPN